MKRIFLLNVRRTVLSGNLPLSSGLCFLAWWIGMTRGFLSDNWYVVFILGQGLTITFYLLIIFSCLAGVTFFCEDYRHGFYRHMILKSGLRSYISGTMGAAALTSFLSCFLGTFGYLLYLMIILPAPDLVTLQGIASASCFGSLTLKYYFLIAFLQCLMDAMLAMLVCCVSLAVSAWIPHQFTVLCLPMILFWLEFTVTDYVFHMPAVLSWDTVFNLYSSNARNVQELALILLCHILFWYGISLLLFHKKVKMRFQNE